MTRDRPMMILLVLAISGCVSDGGQRPTSFEFGADRVTGKEVRPAVTADTSPRPTTANAPDQRPGHLAPERVAARAMAVWIAPWEDERGNLHEATRIYAEVDPQRWSYPTSATDGRMTVLRPLQVESRSSDTTGAPDDAAPLTGAPAAPLVPVGPRRGA